MSGGTTRYRRLPGRGPRKRGFLVSSFSRCRLYLGEDHLLAVENHAVSEDYRRFYYSDIEAIITRKTIRGVIWGIVLASLFTCSLAGALLIHKEFIRILFWFLSGALVISFVINFSRGPTCVCHIRTAVQEDELPSLNRLRVARRVIGILRETIEKVQGTLTREQIDAAQGEALDRSRASLDSARRPRAKASPIRHNDGTSHLIAFALLLSDGLIIAVNLLHHMQALTVFSYVLGLAYTLFIVISLARQHGSDIPGPLRNVTWASFGFILTASFGAYVVMMITLVSRGPQPMMNQWDVYQILLELSPHDSPFLFAFFVFSAICSLGLGALGLIGAMRHRSASAMVPRPIGNPGGEPRP